MSELTRAKLLLLIIAMKGGKLHKEELVRFKIPHIGEVVDDLLRWNWLVEDPDGFLRIPVKFKVRGKV